MRYSRLLRLLMFVGVMVSNTPLRAQFYFEPGFSSMFDDNINNNALQIKDRISVLTLTAGHAWDTARWNATLAYTGNLNYYQSTTDRTNQSHLASLSLSRSLGEDDEDLLEFGLSYGRGFYRGDYSLYDHAFFTGAFSYKGFLSERLLGNAGYTFRSMSFSEIPDFSYSEHVLTSSLSVAAAELTTFILGADLASKVYANSNTGTQGASSGSSAVSQLTGGMRIGQGIVEGTGVSVSARYQLNLQKQMKSLLLTYGAVSDDELFDDHYGYEGLHANVMLTQVVSESILMRLSVGDQERSYTSLPAFDLDGYQLSDRRLDSRSYLALTFQKTFEKGISLKAAFDLIRNRSNDPFYDYSNQALTIQLSYPF